MWGCYVTVADADATAKRCVELGGKVIVAPTDIPNVGRFAVILDKRGAALSVIAYKADAGLKPAAGTRKARIIRARAHAHAHRQRAPGDRSPNRCPSARRGDRAALREHQVIIVCGETGSGKPRSCPRSRSRWAAAWAPAEKYGLITPAARVAASSMRRQSASPRAEVAIGEVVNKVHLPDRLQPGLGQTDDRRHPARRNADRYRSEAPTTLIIDEAHERSLNIDFLLGYLKNPAAPARPEDHRRLSHHRR